MSKEEITREIKPRSEIPASHEEITSDIPDRKLSTSLASDLVGMRRAHFKKVVRESLNESIGSTATLQQIADVYAISRPSPSILSQRHFTTNDGMDGLIALIEYLESEGKDRDDSLNINTVRQGSCLEHFRQFPKESIQTVITSPPYWGMRVYSEEFNIGWSDGTVSPFGGESTPEQYIRNTLELFIRMRPILEETGTIWWNVGDVYNTRTQIRTDSLERMEAVKNGEDVTWAERNAKRHSAGHEYLKDKDLTLIPHQIGKGLQRCGFYVRSVIFWHKRNVVPETVSDRPTVSYEVILLVSKSKRYKFDEQAWRDSDMVGGRTPKESKNLRNVWQFNSAPGKDAHGAPFPVELPARCATLTADDDDIVYDPFMGSGTTAVAASKLGRPWVGSEIAEEYIEITESRLDAETTGDWAEHSSSTTVESSLNEFTDT